MTRLARLTQPSPAPATLARRLAGAPGRALSWKTLASLLVLGLLLSILAGCSPVVQPEQVKITAFLPLEAGKTVGQTFSARYDGLQSLAVYITPEVPGQGEIRLDRLGRVL